MDHRAGARTDGLASGSSISTPRARRLAWLLAHPDIWRGAPSSNEDVDDAGRAILNTLGQRLVAEGLLSSRSLREDRSWGLRVLITEARRRLPS